MIRILPGLIFISLFACSIDARADCKKPAYGSKSVSGIIEIEVDPTDHSDFFKITIPRKVKGLAFESAHLRKGCIGDSGEVYSIPLAMKVNNKVMKTEIFITSDIKNSWRVHAVYLSERKENEPPRLDGPAIESWVNLVHNKKPSVLDGSVEPVY
jgi:hypothetical protein